MPGPEAQLASGRTVLGLLHVLRGDGRAAADAAAVRLRRLFDPSCLGISVAVRWHEPARAVVAVAGPGRTEVPDVGCWGSPLGPGSTAGGGPWVRWELDGRGASLTTSGTLMATLRQVTGPEGTAWATRSLAANVLAGRVPEVSRDAVPGQVLLESTFGDEDLLIGTTRLPASSVVRCSPRGYSTSRWAEDVDRYSPREPTTLSRLQDAAVEVADDLARLPDVSLGLTAGLDSGLLAGALVRAGHRPPAFTMGWSGLPDVDGARVRAAALGLPHHVVPLQDAFGHRIDSTQALPPAMRRRATGRQLDVLRRATRWTDGCDMPRNLLVGRLAWDGPPVLWLVGTGADARAVLWRESDPEDAELDVVLRPRTAGLSTSARTAFAERIRAELDLAASWGRPGRSALDVLYLRTRVRNWLGHGPPDQAFTGVVPGLLEPGLVRVLLDVPEAARLDGSTFRDAALGLLTQGGCRPSTSVSEPASAERRRRWRRPRDPLSDWPLLHRLLRATERTGPGLARDVMGETWWRQSLEHAPSRPYVRQWLWSALAVDLLATVAADV